MGTKTIDLPITDLELSGKSAKSEYMNADGTFKGGFDGCVLYMQSAEGGSHDEESAKKICGKIAQEKSLSLSADDGHWITVNGAHILIKDGAGSKEEQVSKFLSSAADKASDKAKESGDAKDHVDASKAHRDAYDHATNDADRKRHMKAENDHAIAAREAMESGEDEPHPSVAKALAAGQHIKTADQAEQHGRNHWFNDNEAQKAFPSKGRSDEGKGFNKFGKAVRSEFERRSGGGGSPRISDGKKRGKKDGANIHKLNKNLGLSLNDFELDGLFFPEVGELQTYLELSTDQTPDGKPIKRFRKEIIRCGQFGKPASKTSEAISFEITPDSLQHWVATFSQMKEDGVQVWFPEGHTNNPGMNRGYWENLEIAPSTKDPNVPALWGTVDVIGEDGLKLIGRTDVSLYSPAKLEAGNKKVYQRPIVHIAACSDPVIPGLGQWQSVAACLSPIDSALELATSEDSEYGDDDEEDDYQVDDIDEDADADDDDPADQDDGDDEGEGATKKKKKGSTKSDDQKLSLTQGTETMNIATICRKLNIDIDKVTADNAETLILAGISKLEERNEALVLSHGGKPADPVTVKLARENRIMKLNTLIDAGRITPAAAEQFAEKFATSEGLSLSLNFGDDKFDDIVRILAENQPTPYGERTRAQVKKKSIKLARGDDDDDSDDDESDDDEDSTPDKDVMIKEAERRKKSAGAGMVSTR